MEVKSGSEERVEVREVGREEVERSEVRRRERVSKEEEKGS